MTAEAVTDVEHSMNKMLLSKSLMKNLIIRVLPGKLIKMLCLTKFVVKSFLNSYIWDPISLLKTTISLKITASLTFLTVLQLIVLIITSKKELSIRVFI